MNYSDSESESSSAASPSPPTSPYQQQGSALQAGQQPPSLERLVLHFVAAKKSLAATQHVYRATELASSSRALVEEIAALNAKTSYARRGVDEQLETLREIRGAIADAGGKAGDEFQATIDNLDVANDRLQSTLETLRNVIPKRSLQKKKLEGAAGKGRQSQHSRGDSPDDDVDEDDGEDGQQQRTLYDFVDEAKHEGLLASLRGLIDTFNDSRDDLNASLVRFDESIASIVDAVQGTDDDSHGSNPPSKITPYDEPPLSIPALFHDMESHAAEMATLLHSLISHYDLCVSALKHTEGGGEAAREAVRATEDTAAAKNAAGVEESLYGATIPDPMDADERAEMLRVLENDAAEVEDVVGELRERGGEMEGLYAQLNLRAEISRRSMSGLRRALEIMRTVKSALPVYLDAISGFGEGWANVRLTMQEKTQELVDLCGFYENFWASYKELLREVERRAVLEAKMVKVAEKARADLEALAEADSEARQDFVDDWGGFLPGDIWPDLGKRGSRWIVERVADDVEGVADDDDVEEEEGEGDGETGDERRLMEG
jgi:autophagy-related protein 17